MYPVIMGKFADPHTVYDFFFKFANIAHMKKICMANFSIKYIKPSTSSPSSSLHFPGKNHFEVEIKEGKKYNRN